MANKFWEEYMRAYEDMAIDLYQAGMSLDDMKRMWLQDFPEIAHGRHAEEFKHLLEGNNGAPQDD